MVGLNWFIKFGYNNFLIEFCDILQQMSKRAENEIRKRIEAAGEPGEIEQLCLDAIEIKNFT